MGRANRAAEMRYARRRDSVEPELIVAAERIGLRVYRINDGADVIVCYGGLWDVWEIKSPGGKLTDLQCKMRQKGMNPRLVQSVQDVMDAKKAMMGCLQAVNQARAWSLRNPKA